MTTFLCVFSIHLKSTSIDHWEGNSIFLLSWAILSSKSILRSVRRRSRYKAFSFEREYGKSVQCRVDLPMKRSCVDSMPLSRPKIEVVRFILVRKFRYFTRLKSRKKTAMSGFKPPTLSMTRVTWDWRSRPLGHHGPFKEHQKSCYLIIFHKKLCS